MVTSQMGIAAFVQEEAMVIRGPETVKETLAAKRKNGRLPA